MTALCALAFARADEFPAIYNSERDTNAVLLSPKESLAVLKLPDGFSATMFASEPDVQNPIGMTWDGRGRLWVAENYTYAERSLKFDLRLRDRILIFEDKDGDGRFDKRQVFTEDVQKLTSLAVGLGGVWAMCPPQLLFIPDKDGDGRPDGPAEVMLDGCKVPADNYHNFANGLHWGPDGWLYGRCGCSAPGELGVPGTPAEGRVPLRGGIWRFDPKTKAVEVVCHGTMNPWGNDFNEFGDNFFVNTVSGHLWQMIPGAHFLTAHTIDPNPRAYTLIDTHADHWHFDTAVGWSKSRDGVANDFGGGHAHMGGMVYLADNWPAEYRNHFFTLNFFGRRANQEILERKGSGYVGKHGKDCLFFGDTWFRGTDLAYGPDGAVFVNDWSDTGECHESTGVNRTSGRIYKVSYGKTHQSDFKDLTKLGINELVELHASKNEWYVRQARVQLTQRAASGPDFETARKKLREFFQAQSDAVMKLRALWSLYAIGGADEEFLTAQLKDGNEYIRAWGIRLLSDRWPLDTVMSTRPQSSIPCDADVNRIAYTLKNFQQMAKSDPSPMVRLALASVLQRITITERPNLAAPLLAHGEDANDHNIPLMVWYGLIPVGNAFPERLATLAAKCQIPLVRRYIARRLGEDVESRPAPLNELLKLTTGQSEEFQADILAGLAEALRGWSKARKPAGWGPLQAKVATASSSALQTRARDLSALFGDGRALDEVKRVALDGKTELAFRKAAVQTLIEQRPPDLRQICEQLLKVRFLNSVAVRGLALYDDPALGESLAQSYRQFHPSERPPVMETLVSRASFAKPMLDEMAEGRIPRADLSAFQARQIKSFNQPALTKRLETVWGVLHDSPSEKQQAIAKWKTKLTPDMLESADKHEGRLVFEKTCAACHTLYGRGGQVGPDLTGSGRDNLDYLLDNIVDPSAVVNADFHMSVVELKDGRQLNGLVSAKTDRTLTLKTMNETLSLERGDVESVHESSLSLMPEGLLDTLNEPQVRNLIAYLMSRTQVP